MKKSVVILIVLFIVAIALIVKNSNKSSFKKELRDFAVADTASVDKLFLVDKVNNSVLLERKGGNWIVNGKYEARKDLIDVVLKTLLRIRVKEPVSNSALATVVKSLAVKSTKVEVYQRGKLVKTFYVGGPTQDSYGTFMILENSSRPFIMEIPGFRGYLSTRFTTDENEWRTQAVFRIPANEIKSVEVDNYGNPAESFKVIVGNNISLLDISGGIDEDFDTTLVVSLLQSFWNLNFSKFIEGMPEKVKDSIISTVPMYMVKVTKDDGEEQWIKAYSIKLNGERDFFGNPINKDPDNFYLLTDKGDLVYAQYFSFGKIFKDKSALLKKYKP